MDNLLRITRVIIISEVKRVLSYKASTLISITLSILSTGTFFCIWWLLYKKFGEINGYTFEDICLMLGVIWCVLGFVNSFLGGISKAPDYIQRGNFIELQLFPYPSFLLLSLKGFRVSSFTDFLLGSLGITYYIVVAGDINPILILAMILFTGIGVYGFYLLMGAVSLFFPRAGHGFMRIFGGILIGPSFYAYGNFPRPLKILLWITTTIPIMILPIEVIRGTFDASLLPLGWIISCLILYLAIFTWQKAERRIESGSF